MWGVKGGLGQWRGIWGGTWGVKGGLWGVLRVWGSGGGGCGVLGGVWGRWDGVLLTRWRPPVAEHLIAQHSAIKMLHSRVRLILEYVRAAESGEWGRGRPRGSLPTIPPPGLWGDPTEGPYGVWKHLAPGKSHSPCGWGSSEREGGVLTEGGVPTEGGGVTQMGGLHGGGSS